MRTAAATRTEVDSNNLGSSGSSSGEEERQDDFDLSKSLGAKIGGRQEQTQNAASALGTVAHPEASRRLELEGGIGVAGMGGGEKEDPTEISLGLALTPSGSTPRGDYARHHPSNDRLHTC